MEILKFPSTTLKSKSVAIDLENFQEQADSVRKLIEEMKETLTQSGGVGLAAPQVGHNVRVILVQERVPVNADTSGLTVAFTDQRIDTHVMINPEIVWSSNEKYIQVEGCLSFPGVDARIKRNEAVRVKWFDLEGFKEKTFSGFTAACVQHEVDHLDGILLPDRIGPLKAKFTQEYFRKQK
jgi:peptide deformylase